MNHKQRRLLLNLFATALMAIALYLNFIHKDENELKTQRSSSKASISSLPY
jgi:hypothetical protein